MLSKYCTNKNQKDVRSFDHSGAQARGYVDAVGKKLGLIFTCGAQPQRMRGPQTLHDLSGL